MGITTQDVQKLFQAFEQVGDRGRKSQGTGLGLAISQQIVQLMGGRIEVKSQIGVGSDFFFDIELPTVTNWVQQLRSDAGNIVGYEGFRRQILVVDDRWENRGVLVSLLTPLGFVVIEAENGCDGLEKMRSYIPDLTIIDVSMPVMDGFEMLRKLRSSEKLKHIKVIVSSASVTQLDRLRSMEAGGDDFLAKPVALNELLSLIEKHLAITWIYNEVKSNTCTYTSASINPEELVAPQESELQRLLEYAQDGLLKRIIETTEQIQQLDSRYQPFAQHLLLLAEQFQIEKIEAFLQQFIK